MNLVEILKNVPKGTKLYSPLFGEVTFNCIQKDEDWPIVIKTDENKDAYFAENGKYNQYVDCECMLFPSKENRDWNTFKVESPYNFKPFDKVLVRNEDNEPWNIQFFGYYDMIAKDEAPYVCLGNSMCIADTFKQCIPFEGNEKLLGYYYSV